ncbi:MAG: hypothetical protein MUO94_05475 [Thermoplasmata archaeon]|nr:hypothetical protein [Thermoplasmata archaeon]
MKLVFDRTAMVWGVSFAVVAILSGMFLLEAVDGGFLAEGFFLLTLFWVLIMVGIAKLVDRVRRGGRVEEDGP